MHILYIPDIKAQFVLLLQFRIKGVGRGAGAYPSYHNVKGGVRPGQANLLQDQNIKKNKYSLTRGQLRITSCPNLLHIFGLWGEARTEPTYANCTHKDPQIGFEPILLCGASASHCATLS